MLRQGQERRSGFATLGAIAALLIVADAQLPLPRVTGVFPQGAQIGSEVDVQFSGQDLDGLEGVEFSHDGIRGVLLEHPVDEFGVPESDGQNGFRVQVAEGVPAGVYELRARGAFGVSNAVLFEVGRLPEVAEVGGNSSRESAMALDVPVVVNGRADDNSIDYYAIEVGAGSVTEITCRAEAIDSKADPVVEVLSAEGKPIESNNDARGRDSRVVLRSEAGGRYLLKVYDLLFEGGGDYHYRLSVGGDVSAESVFPNVVRRGEASDLLVRFSDGRTERKSVSVQEADAGGLGKASITGAGIDWTLVAGIPVGVSDLPVVLESESNDDWEAATRLAVPCVAAGQVAVGGDRDRYVFEAKKGESLVLEVIGDRLGEHADFAISVFGLKRGEDGSWGEQRVVENDDAGWDVGFSEVVRTTRDPRVTLNVGEDGLYGVKVWNQFSGANLAKHYGLRIGPATAAFRLVASVGPSVRDNQKVEPTPLVLRAGGSAVIDVWVERRDGFGGDVRLAVEGLREGIECREVVVPGGQTSGMLVLRDVGVGGEWSGRIRVVGQAGDAQQVAVFHSPRWGVANPTQERFESRYGDDGVVVSVIGEQAAFEIESDISDSEVEIGGSMEIPVKLKLNGELKGELKIYPEGIAGMKKRPELKLTKDQLEGKLVIDCKATNENKLAAGVNTVVLRGEGQVAGYRPAVAAVTHWEAEKARMDGVVAELESSIKSLEASGATEDPVTQAKAKLDRAVASRKRVEEFLKRANDRAKAQDRRAAVFGKPFVLRLREPEKKGEQK